MSDVEIIFLILRILIAAALYAFLGWALWLIWTSLRRQSDKQAESELPAITLTQAGEPPNVFHFSRPEVGIGRQPGSDLQLDDASISARHARLVYRSGQWWVEDLHSRNGTFVNGERISTALALASGDELGFGGVALEVEVSGALAPEDESEI